MEIDGKKLEQLLQGQIDINEKLIEISITLQHIQEDIKSNDRDIEALKDRIRKVEDKCIKHESHHSWLAALTFFCVSLAVGMLVNFLS